MNKQMLNRSWDEVCEQVKSYDGVDAAQVHAFFLRLHAQAMSDGFLMLTADNDFIKKWVERHYLELIKQALFDLHKIPYNVIIEVDSEDSDDGEPSKIQETPSSPVATSPTTSSSSTDLTSTVTPVEPIKISHLSDGGDDDLQTTLQDDIRAFQQKPNIDFTDTKSLVSLDPLQPSHHGFNDPYNMLDSVEYKMLSKSSNSSPAASYEAYRDAVQAEGYSPLQQQPVMSDAEYRAYKIKSFEKRVQSIPSSPDQLPTSSLSFENFVIGDSNRMAYSMAVAVAETPGKAHLNPLFIYGKSGLGKTHLLRAIQNYILEVLPQLKVVYVDSAELLNDFMEAGAAHDRDKSSYKNFKTYYEEADVLLIDDVQFLQGKPATLDIVFQIFNKMTSQGKQVVLSADRAPKNIDIDERYKSRFNSGGTFDIQPPEVETKLGIVKNFIEEYKRTNTLPNLKISDDVQIFIAENSSSNIRELKSAVTKILYQLLFFEKQSLSLDEVKIILENHFSGGLSKRLTVMDIQKEVERFYGISHTEMTGKKRSARIVYARQIAIYLCRQLLDLPFNDIGKHFNKDHSTVMYSVSNVEEKLKESRDVREELEALKRIIREL